MTSEHFKQNYPKQWEALNRSLDNQGMLVAKAKTYKAKTAMRVNCAIPTLGLREQPLVDAVDTLLTSTYQNIRIIVVVQENEPIVKMLHALFDYAKKVEIVSEPRRIGWVKAINSIAKREGHLFALADDIAVTRETIEILVAEMDRLFPGGDGVLGTNMTYPPFKDKRGFDCAFPFIGNKFINRFPGRQVLCPDFIAYGSDVELPDYALSVKRCVAIPAAHIIHFERRATDKEETSKITREAGLPDIETYFKRQQKKYLWGRDFKLLKNDVQPFLTILTRCHPKRPECVKRNVEFVKGQTDNDVQHLLLRPKYEPRKATPRENAIAVGPLIYYAAQHIRGQYVLQVDDDDMLATPDFVKKMKAIVTKSNPDMIIFRCRLGNKLYPLQNYWDARQLKVATIPGPCVMVKKEIYDQASHEWLRPVYESDFHYIETCFKLSKKTIWADFLGTCSQGQDTNNVGRGEKEFKIRGTKCAK
jgi:hypothetical protein